MRYRFGDFVVDAVRRRLTTRDGRVLVVAPRLFDALLFFVEHAGQLLDKDTLLSALWPGIVVEENSLSQTVSALRRLLGDDAQDSRYLQTVPRRGFRFIAAVTQDDGADLAPADVDGGTSNRPDSTDPVHRRRFLGWTIGGASTLAIAAGAAWWGWRPHRSGPASGSGSQSGAALAPATLATLAVLPFRPLVTTARDELLEMGMADSLVARLSNLPGVVVRSVGSVHRFAGPDQDPIAAARTLEVQWIVDGSIQRWGDQVRVTARLLDTSAGQAAWSGSFDERFTSVFDLQDAISARVAAVLAPHLKTGQMKRLEGPGGTRDLDAYQFYLAARQQAQGVRSAGLVKSIELFDRAIAIDPAYALAYTGSAESHRRMIFGADGEPKVVFAAIERSARRALAIDPDLAEAHSALGWERFWHAWDWAGAESVFQHAIALNPNEATAHFGYGQLLDCIGRSAESVEQMRITRELDPLSPVQLTLDAATVFFSQDKAEGLRRLSRVFDIDPDFWVAHLTLGTMMLSAGRTAEGLDALERAERLSDGSSQPAMALGYALAKNGEPARARAMVTQLLDQEHRRYVPPTAYGLIQAALGETAAALDALEKALAVRDVRLTLIQGDARWLRAVGAEPRFRAVLRKIGLAP